MMAMKNTYKTLVGKPGGKRPLEKPSRRSLYNIRMDVKEIAGCGLDLSGW
jgi:hypothetical protein